MRTLAAAAAVAGLIAGVARAEDMTCATCAPDEIREVAVMFVDRETVENLANSGGADAWFQDNFERASEGHPGLGREERYEVATEAQILTHLRAFAASCTRIRSLNIYSHGNPGTLTFPEGGGSISLDELDSAFPPGSDCLMTADAEINLTGCNSGLGCAGADLMAGLRERLLSKGGRVNACRGSGRVFGAIAFLTGPICFSPVSLARDSAGSYVPSPLPSCSGEIDALLEGLARADATVDRCGERVRRDFCVADYPVGAQMHARIATLRTSLQALRSQRSGGWSWPGMEDAVAYRARFTEYNGSELEDVLAGDCPSYEPDSLCPRPSPVPAPGVRRGK